MTLFISHRGNLIGTDESLENNPNQIEKVLSRGFDCEVDLHKVGKDLYLGHDNPQYKVTYNWLLKFTNNLWIHAKNFDALNFLVSCEQDLNYFWHQDDDFTLTSRNIIWTYPGKQFSENSIIVKLDYEANYINKSNLFGICSDYIEKYKNEI
jgi:hypothetical protein